MKIGRYWLRAHRLCALASITSSLKDAVIVNSTRAVEKEGCQRLSEQCGTQEPAQREIAVTTVLAARRSSAN